MSVFGDRLKLLRKEKEDLTQSKLGELLSVQKGTVSNWENGNRFPDEKTLTKLADFYDVSVDYLLGRTDKRKPNHITKEEMIELAPDYKWLFEEEGLEYIELYETMKTEDIPPDVIKNIIDMILQSRKDK